MNRKKSLFFLKSFNKNFFILFLLLNSVFFSYLLISENNFYHKNTELIIKSQYNLSTPSILPNLKDMQTFNQFDEISINYKILFCNNSNFILKINNTVINFGIVLNDGFNLTHNIDSTQLGIFKIDLYIFNQTNPINPENLLIFNSLSIQIINESNVNIPLLLGLGLISITGLLFLGLRYYSSILTKKSIQKFMKDPILRKNYNDLINSEVILSDTVLNSVLHDVHKSPLNIDLDIETLDNEEFLANFRGIQLK